MSSTSRVVIVGGGIAGALFAKHIQNDANVTLIDPKEYFNITWAALRSMVDSSFAERTLVNYSEFLTQVTLVTSSATRITENEVFTRDGYEIPYDYLVIATGHAEFNPLTRSEGLREYQEARNKIRSSRSILIVGGGPTGVEFAGEIVDQYPDKKIYLVHSGSRLLEFIGSRASQKTLEWLTSKNIDVTLGQSVNLDSASEGTYQTSGGDTIVADCYFKCTGKPIGSSWLRGTMLEDNFDTQGRLVVDKHLRVNGHTNIFAIGDITNVPELKQGYVAMRHALAVAKSLRSLLGGGTEDKLTIYTPGSPMAFVSLGKKEAVAQIHCFTFSGCLPGLIKSRDLFVGNIRKKYGIKPDVI